MAKEKTVRILYMSGLWLPFHKQTSSYFCVFYLDILFLSLSTVWHLDFKKDWIHRKVLHMIYLEKVEFLLLKFRNVWKVIIDATEMVNAIFSLKKEWKETHQGKKKQWFLQCIRDLLFPSCILKSILTCISTLCCKASFHFLDNDVLCDKVCKLLYHSKECLLKCSCASYLSLGLSCLSLQKVPCKVLTNLVPLDFS